MIVTMDEIKNYLRIDFEYDDAMLENLMAAAEKQCMDILRTEDITELERCPNAKIAVMYVVAYLYENRNDADFNGMNLTVRALLFGDRKEGF